MDREVLSYDWPEVGPSKPPRSLSSRVQRRRNEDDDSDWHQSRRYAVLVDAGSSGSRLQVYSWKDPAETRRERLKAGKKLKILPKVEKGTEEGSGQEWQFKVEPGMSSFADHPQDIASYLDPLFRHALDVIPRDAIQTTPVYVMATAGMRLIEESQRQEIIKSTCNFITHSTPFQLTGQCSDHVQVITGEEEGLLGWIAINYLMDGFHFKEDEALEGFFENGVKPTKGKSTYGFLDMGGASTQIAFEPSKKALSAATGDSSTESHEDLSPVTLKLLDGSKVTHDVFVTTFLGFGTNKARERYESALLSNASDAFKTIADPCLPDGARTSTNSMAQPMQGSGSFTQCLTKLSPLLDKTAPCSHPPCLFHGIHVPPIDFSVNHFIGVSEYWFSSNDVFGLGGAYDYVSFQKAAERFCQRPWSELDASLKKQSGGEFPPQVDEKRLMMQCFKSAWMVTVLHDGIGLPRVIDHKGKGDGKHHADEVGLKAGLKNLGDDDFDHDDSDMFQSVNEIEGTAVSWTLGKAVLEASEGIDVSRITEAGHGQTQRPVDSGHKSEDHSRPVPPWYAPGKVIGSHMPELSTGPRTLSGLAFVAVLIALIIALGAFVVTRGRSPAAERRRKWLRKMVCGVCSERRGPGRQGGSGGQYSLANMEEGSSTDGVVVGTDGLPLLDARGRTLFEDTSSSEEDVTADQQVRRTVHRRRRSSGSLLALLPLAARRWVLTTASYIPGTASSRRATRKKQRRAAGFTYKHRDSTAPGPMSQIAAHQPAVYVADEEEMQLDHMDGDGGGGGLRRAFSPNVMRESRASSPALASLPAGLAVGNAISRPASRSASGRHSPRVMAHNGQGISAWTSMTPVSAPFSSPQAQGQQHANSWTPSMRPTSPSYFGSTGGSGPIVNDVAPMAWTSSSNASAVGTGTTTPVAASPGYGSHGGGGHGGPSSTRLLNGSGAGNSLAGFTAAIMENRDRWEARRQNGTATAVAGGRSGAATPHAREHSG